MKPTSVLQSILLSLSSLAGIAVAGPIAPQIPLGVNQLYERPDHARVNLSLYVMSRCPDARLCENVFGEVFRSNGLLDKVDLSMKYIGKLNTSDPLGATCKHGPEECIGNAHQLCLYQHLSPSLFIAALECMNYPSSFPKDIGTVKFTKQCVQTIGLDWWESGVGKCVQGDDGEDEDDEYAVAKEGKKLLRVNVGETERSGITTSCTVEIDSTLARGGKRTCAVDGGVWKGCDDGHTAADFIRVIEAEWENLRKAE